MPFPIARSNLEKSLILFKKMYDAVRIVDPLKKRVLECSKMGVTDEICYDYWKNGAICDNCISIRAYRENKSFVKLEYNPAAVMVVTALPLDTAGEPAVLELLKNATDSMLVGSGDYSDGVPVRSAIESMNELAMKDRLTSLYNRRFVEERLPTEILEAAEAGTPLSVVFLDVDNLKSINDEYGHAAGDKALAAAADAIRRGMEGEPGWAARYGGDEFLILQKADGVQARRLAEKIRVAAEQTRLPAKNGDVNLSLSIGIHTLHKAEETAEELINAADRRMYEAKRAGKNRIAGD